MHSVKYWGHIIFLFLCLLAGGIFFIGLTCLEINAYNRSWSLCVLLGLATLTWWIGTVYLFKYVFINK